MSRLIYLDNNATTKIDPRVLDAMMPFFTEEYGNAGSNHEFGVSINQHVKKARAKVADLIGCESNEIVFTSGATEAINLAIKGVAEKHRGRSNHIVTVTTEHPAVLDTCKSLEAKGFEVTYLPVQPDGIVDLETVEANVRDDTLLVSVMLVNNETGVIQPIREIAEITHRKGAFFMSDGTQAVGKMVVDVNELGIDLMAFSAHKLYGPKGVGGLYVRSRRPNKVKLEPLIHGGGHEHGTRSGTLNVSGIIGLGKAAEIALAEMNSNAQSIRKLRDELELKLLQIEGTFINGNFENRLYNITNICFKGADGDAIISGLEKIMVSNGSACSSSKVEPSHVLISMGLSNHDAYSSIRFSLGRNNILEDVNQTILQLKAIIKSLRAMAL